jgi:NAD(P)-dependent dehydrogenase (short-subunit alcohol dehydrogenase family)
MQGSLRLDGAAGIVTGGGSGLGRAVAQSLPKSGACVAIADINPDAARETLRSLDGPGKAIAVDLDVADEDSSRGAVESVLARLGRIDFLINSAGTDVTLPLSELAIDQWDSVLGVNLRGPFLMTRHVLPAMTAQGAGHIVNIISTAAKRAWPNASAYHASKWGLLGLSYALHSELRVQNIKVTAVVAGGMKTPFLLDRFPDIDESTLQDPRSVAETVKFVLCQPQESVIPEIMVLPMKETSWP